jgi:hypothetical protein
MADDRKRKRTHVFIFSFLCLYSISILYNIVHFHHSGIGSIPNGKIDGIDTEYPLKFEDDLATKLGIASDDEAKSSQSSKSITKKNPVNSSSLQQNITSQKKNPSSYRDETNVFEKMLERSSDDAKTCSNLHPDHLGDPKAKDFDTGVPPLPENGIHEALKAWIDGGHTARGDYPMCELPPTKSCHVSQYSLILMSHTVDDNKRLGKLANGIKDFAQRPETAEIILVWNSERKVLEESEKKDAKRVVDWNNDESHPLRIFYSLENGLQNNLLNRYHPMIKPKQEAIVYFDDDGPFYDEGPMRAGFNLWKFNSDVQVGSLTRNIRYPSKRMDDLQNKATELAADHYRKNTWQTHVHPYDKEGVNQAMEAANEKEPGYPQFTPICRDETGDNVEYNYFVFPNYKAHMSLPSGSILHRNYLCYVWHPVFNEIRQFILDHPTHPDDMTISTLVSHLTGKPLRTFARHFQKEKKRRNLREEVDQSATIIENLEEIDSESIGNDIVSVMANDVETIPQNERRRRLLWQQKDWGNMREEAINSILGYFGSINPGSVGWCAGTEYEKPAKGKGNMKFNCEPEFPKADMVPWMNEGGLGYDECPK